MSFIVMCRQGHATRARSDCACIARSSEAHESSKGKAEGVSSDSMSIDRDAAASAFGSPVLYVISDESRKGCVDSSADAPWCRGKALLSSEMYDGGGEQAIGRYNTCY
jgi:hypothetical protein